MVDYSDSGVDIEAADDIVSSIKSAAEKINSKFRIFGTTSDFAGALGGLCGIDRSILVSSTDGVGTKLLLAQKFDVHNTIGIDLVAMSVNDVMTRGAKPLFFLDYIAMGKLNKLTVSQILAGIIDGCRISDVPLLGGETAEMPDMYCPGVYDLAGFSVGIVDEDGLLPKRDDMKPGDVLIGIESSGVHSNGFSLIRKIFKDLKLDYADVIPFDYKVPSCSWIDYLLVPTKIYLDALLTCKSKIKGAAHITGGGLIRNVARILPCHLSARISKKFFQESNVFSWLSDVGNVSQFDMLNTFNCGIGMVLVSDAELADDVCGGIDFVGYECSVIGSLVSAGSDRAGVEFDYKLSR